MGFDSDLLDKAVIEIPEAAVASLDEQIRSLSIDEQRALQAQGQLLFNASLGLSCFS